MCFGYQPGGKFSGMTINPAVRRSSDDFCVLYDPFNNISRKKSQLSNTGG